MVFKKELTLIAGIILIGTALFMSCDQKKDDDNDDDSAGSTSQDPGEGPGTIQVASELELTAPKDLAVASVSEPVSAATAEAGVIQVSSSLTQGDPPPPSAQDYKSKVDQLQKVLQAESIDDCLGAVPQEFSFAQGNIAHASCFGPAFEISGHPDWPECPRPPPDEGSCIANGDTGIFSEYAEYGEATGEACAARVVNNLMRNVAAYIDTATGLQAMAICAGKVAGLEIPDDGTALDLTSGIADIDTTKQNFAVSAAAVSIETEGDASVYTTTLSAALTDVPRSLTKNIELTVRHIPAAEDNSKYTGAINYIVKDFENGNDLGISIKYKWGENSLQYRYRQSQVPSGTDPFDSATNDLKEEFANGRSEVVVDSNNYGLGKLAFVWNTFDHLVFNVETKTDGTGVAYFGHAPNTTAPSDADYFKVKGLRCLPINPPPAGHEPYSSFVQSQKLKLNTTSLEWEPNGSKITFAPTKTCSWDTDSGASFVAQVEGGPADGVSLEYPVEHDLDAVESYKTIWGTGPTGP